jgi:Exostosin family
MAILASAAPIALHFEASARGALRDILLSVSRLFVEADPANARLIVFGNDTHAYVDGSPLYREYRDKCVCIAETDTPTFRLPGIYAANSRSLLTEGRIKTANYFISERYNSNPEIRSIDPSKVEKKYLYSFMGGSNSWARKHLFRLVKSQSDTVVEATDSYNHWAGDPGTQAAKDAQRRRYAETMAASKFALCPRGCGLSSYRLFESMSLGIAPVVVSDAWKPISEIDWSFAIFVPERKIAQLDSIVRAHATEWQERGRQAHLSYWSTLGGEQVHELLYGQLVQLEAEAKRPRELLFSVLTRLNTMKTHAAWDAYARLKHVALSLSDVTGIPLPIQLHQPIKEQLERARRA